MRFFSLPAVRVVTFLTALSVSLSVALTASLPVGVEVALAASTKSESCTSGRTTAPFLISAGARSPKVSGSILVVTRGHATTISTPGATAPRTSRPSVEMGEAWLAFCVQGGRVTPGASLVATRAGGLSIVATAARRLALTQTTGGRTRTVATVALAAHSQLVVVVLDRLHQQASVLVNGGRRASVRATIPATTVVVIGSAAHPAGSGVIAVPAASAPSSTNAGPQSTPAKAPTTPATTSTSTTKTATVPTGVTTQGTVGTTTAAASPVAADTSPAGPATTGDTAPAVALTAAQASTVPFNAFSPTSFWNTPLASNAALDPNSQGYVSDLVSQVNSYGVWMNTTSYSIPAYVVPATQPTVTVHLSTWGPDLQQQFNAVPIPPGAKAAAGTDGSLTVWQPATDKMWDFWQLSQSSTGTWTARWGGEMDHVSTSPGYFTHSGQTSSWGATASGLPLLGGLITIADLKRGYINHALAMAVPQASQGVFAWPAQRTDGRYTGGVAIPEGMRFRLDPSINVAALNLPYFEKMLAQAAQTYGIVVRDQSGCVSLYAQDPTTTGSNPWTAPFDGWSEGTYLSWFPWSHLQAIKAQLSTGS
jgi:hypothetical protein